ncbi:MAG TPA: iron-sulfur cluster assembly protein [Bacteroidales bacterium]|jgi:FeS assembly SUF system protein|nr:iron-sulfur cluster assembly protein [Bacteroidales bacterium]
MKSKKALKNDIINVLKQIYDPEIPISIWDLGLIYDISFQNNKEVTITMTLTAPNCPEAENLPATIQQQIKNIPEIEKVTIQLTFSPPWSINKLSDAAKLELGFL